MPDYGIRVMAASVDGHTGYRPGETVEFEIVIKNTGTMPLDGATIDLTEMKAEAGSGYTVAPETGQVTITELAAAGTVTVTAKREVTQADFSDGEDEKTFKSTANLKYQDKLDVTAESEDVRICRSEYAVTVQINRTNKAADED